MTPLRRTRSKPDTPEAEKLAAITRCPLWNGWTGILETRHDQGTLKFLRAQNAAKELESAGWVKGFLFALKFSTK